MISKLGVGGSNEGDVLGLLLPAGDADSGGNLNDGCPYASDLPLGEVGESLLLPDAGSAGNLKDEPRLSSLLDDEGIGGGGEELTPPVTAERLDCLWLAAALMASFNPNECLLLWPLTLLTARLLLFGRLLLLLLALLLLEPVLLCPLFENDADLEC